MIYVMAFRDSDFILLGTAEWISSVRSEMANRLGLRRKKNRAERRLGRMLSLFSGASILGMVDGTDAYAEAVRTTFGISGDPKAAGFPVIEMSREFDEWVRVNARTWNHDDAQLMGVKGNGQAKAVRDLIEKQGYLDPEKPALAVKPVDIHERLSRRSHRREGIVASQ